MKNCYKCNKEVTTGFVICGDCAKKIKKRQEIPQKAIDTWGVRAQVDICIEEMSELTKALLKYRRAMSAYNLSNTIPYPDSKLLHIREEVADVQIMIEQIKMIYGDTDEQEELKLQRLANLLEFDTREA